MVEPAIGSQDLILGTHGFFENFLLEINTFHRQLMLADHLSFEGIQPMQKSHGECRARAHATARWQVSIMMDLQSAIVIEISQHLAHSWMSDFVDRLAILHLGVDHTEPVLEEGWEITACDITVFVDGRGQHHAAMLAIPCRIIRPSSKEGDPKRGSADDHSSPPVPLESIGHTLILLGLSMCTLSSPCTIARSTVAETDVARSDSREDVQFPDAPPEYVGYCRSEPRSRCPLSL